MSSKKQDNERQVDAVVRCVEQDIYEHGGSRIYTKIEEGGRKLLADTYHTKEFAIDVKTFIEGWMKKHA